MKKMKNKQISRTVLWGTILYSYLTLEEASNRLSGKRRKYLASAKFGRKKYNNQEPLINKEFHKFLTWIQNREKGQWEKYKEIKKGSAPPAAVDNGQVRITFINHSTFLIQMNGVNILTDPIWSHRASPVKFAGPKRVHPPGIAFEDLPKIDFVVISHNHYDHLDIATLKRLSRKYNPGIYVTLGNKKFLEKCGINRVEEFDWWQESWLKTGLKLVSVPARHFSARGLFDHRKTLWAGFVFETDKGSVYFAGDTGFGIHFHQIAERFSSIRAALLPISPAMPQWFVSSIHLSADEALKAGQILKAGKIIPMHYGTFPLGDDGQHEPLEMLQQAILSSGIDSSGVRALEFGEGINITLSNEHSMQNRLYRFKQ